MMGNEGEGGCRPEPPQGDRQGEQEDGESLVIRSHAGEQGKGGAREAGAGGVGGGALHRAAEWAVSLRYVPGVGCREMGGWGQRPGESGCRSG